MNYRQVGDTGPEWRNNWIAEKIAFASQGFPNGTLFDVGAGHSPYKRLVQESKLQYLSQDFNQYVANEQDPGNHTENWHYSKHDYVCDILEIPTDVSADVLLCTEVLEHVPDAVASFKKLVTCVKPGGMMIITVPFISLMHQAPYWYQSGLSPYWFHHWAKLLNVEVLDLVVQGDYVDLVRQDFSRVMQSSWIKRRMLSLFLRIRFFEKVRGDLSQDILTSGGCGTLVLMQRK